MLINRIGFLRTFLLTPLVLLKGGPATSIKKEILLLCDDAISASYVSYITPAYSTDISAAWEVVEKMASLQ